MKKIYLKQLLAAILLLCSTVVSAETYSGTCGTSVNWSLNTETGVLNISGTGAMNDYYDMTYTPWYGSHKFSIQQVIIDNDVTHIGDNAFCDCLNLRNITISNSVTTIGSGAFWGCTDLTNVTIPNSVTTIGDNAFAGCAGLTNVTIPNSVTTIGDNAFCDCLNLRNITISNSVTTIGSGAFASCTGLTNVTIPNSVTTIGSGAFWGCTGLTNVTIPNSVTTIGDNAFASCTGLTNVTIPNSVTTIGDKAFASCTGLKSVEFNAENCTSMGRRSYPVFDNCTALSIVTIGENVKNIPSYAFYGYYNGLSSLTSVTIGTSVTSIGEDAFGICTGLTAVHISNISAWCKIDFVSIFSNPLYYAKNLYLNGEEVTNLVIPSNITEIKNYAFSGCTGLASITIPNSVTSIGDYAFEGCKGLTSIEIPNSVTNIGYRAFLSCTGLKTFINYSSLKLSKDIEYGYADIVINAPDGSIEGDFVFGVIDGVYTLCGYIGNSDNITLPTNYKNEDYVIGANVFSDNSTITSVAIPDGVTGIGYRAFGGCKSLSNITIPNSVTTIGDCAFVWCNGLTSVTIGTGVTTIGDNAFASCTGLTAVHISNLSDWCKIDFVSNYSNPLDYAKNLYLNGEEVTDLVIPSDITEIKEYAFLNCKSLTSITIPNSVTNIGDRAFRGCTGLKTVINLSSLCIKKQSSADNGGVAYYTDIVINAPGGSIEGDFVFGIIDGVYTLCGYIGNSDNIALPTNYKNEDYVIGANLFEDNTTIIGVAILDGVTSIGDNAFAGCTGLTNVTIPNSVTTIGDFAFNFCTGLTSITIGTGVTSIGDYAFCDCTSLTNVTIPNNVTSIGEGMFYDCTGLTSITIPNSVTAIGDYAFCDCTSLTEIYAMAETPVSIEYSIFSNYSATLYVPIGAKEAYQAADYWKEFTNIVEIDFTGIDKIFIDDAVRGDKNVYYDLNGHRVKNPQKGIYIINGKKVVL